MSVSDEDTRMGGELARRLIEHIRSAKGRTKANARSALLAESLALHLGKTAWGWLQQIEDREKEIVRLERIIHKTGAPVLRNTDGSLASEETAA